MSSLSDNTTAARGVTSLLAQARRRRGIAATELARTAGVTRQTIYAMEAGDYIPNTAVALRLARALETTVEDLFALDAPAAAAQRTAEAELIGGSAAFPGAPLELCRVDGKLVAVPAVPGPWHMPPADALLADPAGTTVQLLGDEIPGARLLIAGCDPAVSVLRRHLERAGIGLVTAAVNSSVALQLLESRSVHVAGTHLHDAPPPVEHSAVFRFAVWEQGLLTARRNPKKVRAIEDLARTGVRLANREKGSGSRQLLDLSLRAAGIGVRDIAGYRDRPASGHLEAAWRVHSGLADACVATRSAARAFGLGFVPLTSERYNLVIRRDHLALGSIQRLLDTLTQSALRRELEGLCAYDTRETGNRVQ